MISPRKFAKSVLYHARRVGIDALAAPRALPWLRRRLHLPANEIYDPVADAPTGRERITRLDPGESFRRPLPLLTDANAAVHSYFAARNMEGAAPSYVAEFERGIAWGHPTGGVFTADGRFVPALTHDPCGGNFHTVWTRLHLPRPRRLPGRVLYLVTPEAADNYHHWLIDLLPRLGLVRRAGFRLDEFDHVIVNHSHRPYQLATLNRLGIAADRIVTADSSLFVQADLLVVPSLKPNNQTLPAADIAFLRETFLGARPFVPGHRRIFLSRGDARFRRLLNEADLHPLLRAHDFEIVSPAGLDVPAQAQLFAEAEIIAGPAGAAFANLVFATTPARVIEIVPPQWLATFHWMISARLGLTHTILVGDGPVMRGLPDSSARRRDIRLATEKFAALIEPAAAPSP